GSFLFAHSGAPPPLARGSDKVGRNQSGARGMLTFGRQFDPASRASGVCRSDLNRKSSAGGCGRPASISKKLSERTDRLDPDWLPSPLWSAERKALATASPKVRSIQT